MLRQHETTVDGDVHVNTEQIAAYLDGGLSQEQLGQFETHVADCVQCRREILSISRVLLRRQRTRFAIGGSLAAAVILVIAVAVPFGNGSMTDVQPARQRSEVTPVAPAVTVVTPVGEFTLPRTGVPFTWRVVDRAVVYSLTVSNAEGDEVWSTSTRESTVVAPPGVLIPDSVYFWRVDAQLRDGSSVTSRSQRVRPR